MKAIITHSLNYFVLIALTTIPINSNAQNCPDEKFFDQTVKECKTTNVIETFPLVIKGKKDTKSKDLVYTLTLTKGSTYQFYVRHGENNDDRDMYINLFDKNEKLLSTTYNEFADSFTDKIVFKCKTTGTYYLSYYPQASKYCGVIVYGTYQPLKKKGN